MLTSVYPASKFWSQFYPVVQTFSLRVDTSLDALNQVLSWFEAFKNDPIPSSVWMKCQLALVEGFTNTVRHAHKSLAADTPIDLELTLLPEGLEIRIWDQGAPFDMMAFIEKIGDKVDEEAEGGRGIHLMKVIASHLSYTRLADGRNCLLLQKDYADELDASRL
ncbi:MAG: ATP-binding protein [Cyanobacteriota bacterium]|nr:ATP-binding protein [Cyanobacteriota bacterium]